MLALQRMCHASRQLTIAGRVFVQTDYSESNVAKTDASLSIPARSTKTMWASTSSSTISASLAPCDGPPRSGDEGEEPSSEGAGEGAAEGTSRLC